jgi:hypothetical protein
LGAGALLLRAGPLFLALSHNDDNNIIISKSRRPGPFFPLTHLLSLLSRSSNGIGSDGAAALSTSLAGLTSMQTLNIRCRRPLIPPPSSLARAFPCPSSGARLLAAGRWVCLAPSPPPPRMRACISVLQLQRRCTTYSCICIYLIFIYVYISAAIRVLYTHTHTHTHTHGQPP